STSQRCCRTTNMVNSRLAAAGFAVAALLSTPLRTAAATDELQQLKDQIAEMRQAYEARLQAMEKRLAEMQAAAPPPVAPAAAAPAPVAAAPGAAATSASVFNPAIALILSGTYANLSRDPADYRLQGFVPSGGEVGPGKRSFSL